MQSLRLRTAVACLLLACAPALGCSASASGGNSANAPVRAITVLGEGEARATPDIAIVTLGVETRDQSAEAATAAANERVEAVRTLLKKNGVEEKDLVTSNFSIRYERFPDYPPVPYGMPMDMGAPAPMMAPGVTPAPPTPPGVGPGSGGAAAGGKAMPSRPNPEGVFVVSNQLNVTFRKLDNLGALLGESVQVGANDIWGIQFDIDDDETLLAKARAEAMEDAKRRGQELAKLAGVTLGPVISVRESGAVGPNPPPMPMMFDAAMAKGGAIPIEQGQVARMQMVEVVYGLPEAD